LFPRPGTLLDRLRPGLIDSPVSTAGNRGATTVIADLATLIGPMARVAADLNLTDPGVLAMPAFEVSL
jgi:hypothetical protein